MDKLIDGLRHFQEHVFWERREQFERSAGGQRPQALLVACSDSRVLPETLMQADRREESYAARRRAGWVRRHGLRPDKAR